MRSIIIIVIVIVLGNIPIIHVNAQECLPSRLAIGDEAQVTPSAANRIRSQSNTNSEQIGQIPAGGVMTILDGPLCVDNFLWWNIDYDNVIGWTVEASATDYFLTPYTEAIVAPTALDIEACTVETRLQVDGYGQVSSAVPSRLRSAPSVNGEQIGQVAPAEIFEVIDGPICAESFHWWQVEIDGLVGWLAEGDSVNYYVEVVAESLVLGLTSTPEPKLATYDVSWNADASQVAIATSDGVLIYDTANWALDPYLLDNGVLATDLAFSPVDPDLLVINSNDRFSDNRSDIPFRFRAYLLSDDSESILFEHELMDGPMGGERPADDFAFSEDGRFLGFGGTSYDIFDTETWTRVNQLEIYEAAGNHFVNIYISPSDFRVNSDFGAGAVDRETMQLFDFTIPHTSSFGTADPRITTLDRGGRTQPITALKFSPDGTQVIIGDTTGSLQMWDVETGNRVSFIRADNATSISNRINDIAFHPNGETIATAESDPSGVVRVFVTVRLEPLTVFGTNEGHEIAHVLDYSPDGSTLLIVMDDMVYLLDTTDYSITNQIALITP